MKFELTNLESIELNDVNQHEEGHIKEKCSRLSGFTCFTNDTLCHLIKSTNNTSITTTSTVVLVIGVWANFSISINQSINQSK